MDYGFKFEIGSFVRHIGARPSAPAKRGFYYKESEERMQIVERLLQQCPGGTQRHYKCRLFNASGGFADRENMLNEIELVASAAFEPLPEDDKASA
jgi:hypothetical protein